MESPDIRRTISLLRKVRMQDPEIPEIFGDIQLNLFFALWLKCFHLSFRAHATEHPKPD